MTLTTLDSFTVDHAGGGTRTIQLCSGDITQLAPADAVDFIAVSALPGDYSPSGGSVIAALAQAGVSVQQQSTNKAADYEPTMPCWVSQDVSSVGLNFNRFILFEPANPATQAGFAIPMIFRALSCFVGQVATSIALPMVSTGSAGADFTIILRQLSFMGAHAAALAAWPLSTIKLIVYSPSEVPTAKSVFAAVKASYASPPQAMVAYHTQVAAVAAPLALPANMTQRQYNAVRAYTGSAYSPINAALRANNLANAQYQHWEATIEAISSGLAELPPYQGLTLRGTTLPASVIAQYRVGAIITHISFTSTSRTSPWGGNSQLRITSVAGSDVESISHFPSEHEVLYDYGMTDQVTQVQGASGGYQHIFTSTQVVPNWCGTTSAAFGDAGAGDDEGRIGDTADNVSQGYGENMPLPPVGNDAIDEVLRWLPRAADVDMQALESTGEPSVGHEPEALMNQVAAMQVTGFMAAFDWQAEFADKQADLESAEVVAAADLELLRKIMTAHVRMDRFDPGHLARRVSSGYWRQCLDRLRDLRGA